MITFEISHSSLQLGLLAALTTGIGVLTIDAFQRLNGFSHPLLLALSLTSFAWGVFLFAITRRGPLPKRDIHPLVYIVAALVAALLNSSSFRIAPMYADFNTYLHVRAWMIAVTGLVSIYFCAAFMLSLITLR